MKRNLLKNNSSNDDEKFKDENEKFKVKAEETGRPIEAKERQLQAEKDAFQSNAQANGQAWAQQKGAELSQKEQELNYAQQAMLQQLQQESGAEIDSLVINYRKIIKEYGKEKGYDYIYGSGDAAPSILYAKDSYDITNEIIKIINDKYKSAGKKQDSSNSEQEKQTLKEGKK